jgi:thymidylate kinase
MRMPLGWVETLNAAARPADLTLYLEVDPRTAARRRQGRGGTEELFDADVVQRAVARAYGRVVRKHTRAQRVVRVDGRAAPDEVAREILARVQGVLSRRARK